MTREHTTTGTVEVTGWDEHAYDDASGRPPLARATVRTILRGGICGEGMLEYLIAYHDDPKHADTVGMQRVVGELDGREGSFVLRLTGGYANGTVTEEWSVVPGSATDQLIGLRGHGTIIWHGHSSEYRLDYELDDE